MHFHHCQPTKLGGADLDENKVCCPAAVHWYLHELIGQIGILLENDDLQDESDRYCGVTRAHLGSLFASNWDPDMLRKVRDSLKSRRWAMIERAKAAGGFKGRAPDTAKHERIKALRDEGVSLRKIAAECGCSLSTVQRALGMSA
ncbi:helix-turn-helix domain-containing protein [Shewanella algae]|nr:helix-turn-helix domain-containing protein [Shewanella algae]